MPWACAGTAYDGASRRHSTPILISRPRLALFCGRFHVGGRHGRPWPSRSATSIQLKRLPRLPSLSDSRALTSLVRENVSRFFVHNGLPLMTSALRVDAPGDAWGAAVERPLLDAVARACAIAKMRVTRIVPAATVLGYALAQPAVQQKDPRSTDPGMQPPTRAPAPDPPWPPRTTMVAAVEWVDGPATYLFQYDTGRLVRAAVRRDATVARLMSTLRQI